MPMTAMQIETVASVDEAMDQAKLAKRATDYAIDDAARHGLATVVPTLRIAAERLVEAIHLMEAVRAATRDDE